MLRKYFFVAAATAVALLPSCGDTENTAGQEQETGTEITAESEPESQVTYILPSPYQIAEMFRRAGLSYHQELTQPVEAVSTYNSSFHKNLAFGIYSADLAYALVNNQSQDAITYLKVIRQLAGDLGYGKVFDSESFFTRFEANIGDQDSVAFLLGDLQIAMTDMLSQNNEDYISPIIFSAAWIESMYLGVKSHEKKKDDNLLSRLEEQQILLENMLAALRQHKTKFAGIAPLLALLENISSNFHEDGTPVNFEALKEDIVNARETLVSASL